MSIIGFLIFGFIIGLIARALMPGPQRMGILMTTVLGMVGAFLGGFLGSLISNRPVLDLHPAGFIGSIIGAIIVLALFGLVSRRRLVA
jgi:uncharacterized membrane protein YeaQ/YmgE (transglycosylase-associated protein family)